MWITENPSKVARPETPGMVTWEVETGGSLEAHWPGSLAYCVTVQVSEKAFSKGEGA